jgi:hypothetical protein
VSSVRERFVAIDIEAQSAKVLVQPIFPGTDRGRCGDGSLDRRLV